MTASTRRPTLIPRWLLIVAAFLLVTVGGIVGISMSRTPAPVSTPSVVGLESPVARSRLAQHGLGLVYGDTRFSSDVPEGHVIEQDPAAGTEVAPGEVVMLVVSAGSDAFPMPDVVGMSLEAARGVLEPRGVRVEVESAPSDAPAGTVVASMPAAGAETGTGAVVRLTVSGESGADVLLPGHLDGVIVLLDPEPPVESQADVAMELTRHVRSLLEASGAEVLVTRSIVETQAPAPVRAAWAAEASATVAVGLGAGDLTAGARSVSTLPSHPDRATFYLASVDFARQLVSEIAVVDERVSLALPREDEVLAAARARGARILVGDPTDPGNVETFSDPVWVDRMAAAIYRAIVTSLEPSGGM